MPRRGRKAQAKPVKGGWDVLPHGMGVSITAGTQGSQPPIQALSVAEPPSVNTLLSSANSIPSTTILSPAEITSEVVEGPSIVQPTQPSAAKDDAVTQNTKYKTTIKLKISTPVSPEGIQAYHEGSPVEDETAKGQSKLVGLGTDAVQTSGRRLRPRKPKAQPEVCVTGETNLNLAAQQDGKGVSKKRKRGPKADTKTTDQEFVLGAPDASEPEPKKARSRAKKTNGNAKGLRLPGETPYPEWNSPSAEQCEEVHNLLTEMHGEVKAPEVVSAPSLEVMGCGEVPSVLDGLLRTLLSGATRIEHIDAVLAPLAKRYGVLTEGVGKESINWDNVRVGPEKDLVDAIRSGGLANTKAKHIKSILNMVYDENIELRKEYPEDANTTTQSQPTDASTVTQGACEQGDTTMQAMGHDHLSLEHLRGLPKQEVLKELTKYPGIGVKTAACVILFCLQMPCLAVDTHVHRMSRWLGWAPKNANEVNVFHHLEVRCPDRFKYGLHQLFIRHGQTCGRCNPSTVEGSAHWDTLSECPLEKLVDRYDKKQSKAKSKSPKVEGLQEGLQEGENGDQEGEEEQEQEQVMAES